MASAGGGVVASGAAGVVSAGVVATGVDRRRASSRRAAPGRRRDRRVGGRRHGVGRRRHGRRRGLGRRSRRVGDGVGGRIRRRRGRRAGVRHVGGRCPDRCSRSSSDRRRRPSRRSRATRRRGHLRRARPRRARQRQQSAWRSCAPAALRIRCPQPSLSSCRCGGSPRWATPYPRHRQSNSTPCPPSGRSRLPARVGRNRPAAPAKRGISAAGACPHDRDAAARRANPACAFAGSDACPPRTSGNAACASSRAPRRDVPRGHHTRRR